MDEFLDHLVVVVGSGGRIGTVLCACLSDSGYAVLGVRRTKVNTESLAAHVYSMAHDAADKDFPDVLAKCIQEIHPRQISLVWNARIPENALPTDDMEVLEQRLIGEIRLGVSACAKSVGNMLQVFGRSFKSMVVISSIYGNRGPRLALYEGDVARAAGMQYGLNKAAQIHLVKELAVRYGREGLRVNCVSFGGVEGRVDVSFEKRYAALCPSGRMLQDADLAGPVEFLISDKSSGVTGHNLVVDGGWTIS
jgi:NAD(P)-dependent dehydrogenase (short-subunit alcohol dehydrogenase family)